MNHESKASGSGAIFSLFPTQFSIPKVWIASVQPAAVEQHSCVPDRSG